jgi:hypothetical protein
VKSQMVMSTAVNNFIKNDPYVKIIYTKIYIDIKQSHYKPGQALRVPGG